MVKLDRIYTRGGDRGETSLGVGPRVSKDSLRIVALGEIDETNARVGCARALGENGGSYDGVLARIQNDLFDFGADLCAPEEGEPEGRQRLRLAPEQTAWLEGEIDQLNEDLAPLTSFVLPGGTGLSSLLHYARTGARTAERACVALADAERISPELLSYINRLSDLLFVMARHANDKGRADILWRPGKDRKDGGSC